MITVEARACRLIILDPERPDPARPGRSAPTSRGPAPARLPCRDRRPEVARRASSPAGRRPAHRRRCGPGRCAVDRCDRRMGRGRTPEHPCGARDPPRPVHRLVGGPDRDHHPPNPCPPRCRGAGRCDWRVACRARPPRPPACGRGRRQDPARRPRYPGSPGSPAGGDGPRHSCGARPTPSRRRARRGARLPAAAGRPRPCRRGGNGRRVADPPRGRRVPGDRQAGALPVHGQGQPARAAGPLRPPALASGARAGPNS
jgi:hypothetical protein